MITQDITYLTWMDFFFRKTHSVSECSYMHVGDDVMGKRYNLLYMCAYTEYTNIDLKTVSGLFVTVSLKE